MIGLKAGAALLPSRQGASRSEMSKRRALSQDFALGPGLGGMLSLEQHCQGAVEAFGSRRGQWAHLSTRPRAMGRGHLNEGTASLWLLTGLSRKRDENVRGGTRPSMQIASSHAAWEAKNLLRLTYSAGSLHVFSLTW